MDRATLIDHKLPDRRKHGLQGRFRHWEDLLRLANDGLVPSSAVGQPECKTKADGMFTASSVVSVREAGA
jgi:hypothetical protein